MAMAISEVNKTNSIRKYGRSIVEREANLNVNVVGSRGPSLFIRKLLRTALDR